jgi:hydrogenase maturation factor
MDGLTLTCMYAYHPTKMGYCGPKNLSKDIYKCAKIGAETTDLENAMRGFVGFPAYYSLISSHSGMDFFTEQVAEAYWLGNDLSSIIKTSDLVDHLRKTILKIAMDKEKITKRLDNVPNGCRPTHNFHVLLLGSVTGVISDDVSKMNKCIVNIGEVKKEGSVEFRPLVRKGEKFSFGPKKTGKMKFDFCEAKPGDYVSFHWDYVIQKLNKNKRKNLEKNLEDHIKFRNKSKI